MQAHSNRFSVVLILVIALLACTHRAIAADPAAPVGAPRATIAKRRIVIVRTGKLAREFPERKRAVVVYPVVSGLNRDVLNRIRALFDFKNIFGSSLAEYRSDAWLTDFGYTVNLNQNYILDITFTQSGVGAYPDTHTKHFAINLQSGELIRAVDAFKSVALDELARMVDDKLQAEIKLKIKENAGSQDGDAELYKDLKFDASKLDEFSIGTKGVTFLFDAEFPHVVKALEPDGSYFFTYDQIKAYIRMDGPLSVFVK